MKRTTVFLFALALIFSSGLFAASAFQKTIEKKADGFSGQRPVLILGLDVTREGVENYEVKTFIPDTSFMAKFKKFFTKKDYGVEKIDVLTRKATIINRLEVYSSDKKKAIQAQEITITEAGSVTNVSSARIYSDNEFWEVKKGSASKTKISFDFIAASVLPDWIYMHSQYIKEAIETGEKLNGKTYRFINGKWIRYYVDTDTLLPNTIEVDVKEKNKTTVYKIVFSSQTFAGGNVNIPRKVTIYKGNTLFKEYQISVVRTTGSVRESIFDPAIQSKELSKMAKAAKKAEVK